VPLVRLPRNVKRGQLRKRAGLVGPEFWSKLSEDERDAVDALSLLVYLRAIHDEEHPAFEGNERDELPLTNGCMRAILCTIGARKKGWRAAREAKAWLEREGVMEDTGKVMKPKRQPQMSIREERASGGGHTSRARPEECARRSNFYWWPVYRITALTLVTRSLLPQGAYGTLRPVPKALVSLSTFLRRQGLLPRRRPPSDFNPRSIQWVFAHSGPP
jgi:hypothetical protein